MCQAQYERDKPDSELGDGELSGLWSYQVTTLLGQIWHQVVLVKA